MKNPTAYMVVFVIALIAAAFVFGIISGPLAAMIAACALFVVVATVTAIVQK